MDGYAVAGEIRPRASAARWPARSPPATRRASPCRPPAAARIMTGAPVPAAADRVVPVEPTDGGREGGRPFHAGAKPPGEHIRRRGEILAPAPPCCPRARASPPAPSPCSPPTATRACRSTARRRWPCSPPATRWCRPRPRPLRGQLRDSHTDFLLAAGAALGLRLRRLWASPPTGRRALRALVERGLDADVLLLCGGVSMGELDLVEGVLAELGCEARVRRRGRSSRASRWSSRSARRPPAGPWSSACPATRPR